MGADIPAVSGEAMARIDRFMMDELGVDTLQLMELAGYGVAEAIRQHAGINLRTAPRILALAGTGGNGGDAMVAARLLHAWGARTSVILAKPRAAYSGVAAHQLSILDRMGIPVDEPEGIHALPGAELIIDGLLGFSLRGDPRGDLARLIELANGHPASTVAIDLPSGLEATSGRAGEPCVRAVMTVTLALPKTGLMAAPESLTGRIWLADLGVPPSVYEEIGADVPPDLFADGSLVGIRDGRG